MHTQQSISTYWTLVKRSISLEDDEDIRLYRYYKMTGELSYRNQIVLNNYKLILKWAHKYSATPEDFPNILPEAVLGFIEGIEKFDLKKREGYKNMKLTSYCTIRMRKIICRHLDENGRLVRLPWRHISEARKLLKNAPQTEFGNPVDVLLEGKSSITVLGVLEVLHGSVKNIDGEQVNYTAEDFEHKVQVADKVSYQRWQTEPENKIDILDLIDRCPSITDAERKDLYAHYGINSEKKTLKPTQLKTILARVKVWAHQQL